MSRVSILFAVLFVSGCGVSSQWNNLAPTGEAEGALLHYTAQHATTLSLQTKGAISDKRGAFQTDATGWYDSASDTAYYYRPDVAQYVSVAGEDCPATPRCELATGIAAHEVCHAKLSPATAHDTKHWCCMVNLGVRPTYPPPVTPGGQWPVCK